jgi:hypothetical protein
MVVVDMFFLVEKLLIQIEGLILRIERQSPKYKPTFEPMFSNVDIRG